MLTYYELDLGLNHVVRKWSEPTDPRANLLVQVPGGQLASSDRFDGPSGVLVCCEDHIIYRHMDAPQHRVPIPRRKHPLEDPDRGLIIVAAVMHKMKVCLPFGLLVLHWFTNFTLGSILLPVAKRGWRPLQGQHRA
jgi:splicing factor 3B subunit 3